MIEIEDIRKSFGSVSAVAGLSLVAGKGEVLGFLGPNGAGKSTTMKMVAGFLAPDSGRIRVCGHDIETETLAAQSYIGYLPEGAPAYGDMTARRFLAFIADVRGFKKAEAKARAAAAAAKTELTPVLDQPIETLSKGFKRRVGLAQAILHDPPVLIMDEPTDGLDPNQKHAVRKLIRAMAAQKTIVVSTHILEEVEAICTRAVIIDRGRIVADGTPTELLARSRYHNAVTLVFADGDSRTAQARLRTLAAVAGIEKIERGGDVGLTVFSRNGAFLIEEIGMLAAREHWSLKELYAEPGRLDEVFRAITSHDADLAKNGGSKAAQS
jgi:ABC-2 type transport system ATP-binding protein